MPTDLHFMELALELAKKAAELDEVPVGAVIVRDGHVIASGFNQRESSNQAISHAEIEAIKSASDSLGAWRLSECEMYVTLEPCLMCAGALIQSRMKRVVYGASDPKGGAMGSLYQVHQDERLNHQIQVTSGLMQQECSQILKDFFAKKR